MIHLKPPSQNPPTTTAYNEDSDSQNESERERQAAEASASNSGVPLMERLSATFKKKKLGSTHNSIDTRQGTSQKPQSAEALFVVSCRTKSFNFILERVEHPEKEPRGQK